MNDGGAPSVAARKHCSMCRTDKPTSEFYPRARSKDGIQSHCKQCQKLAANAVYRNAKATPRDYGGQWTATGRLCRACGIHKPWQAFGPRPTGKNGRRSTCRACVAERARRDRARKADENERQDATCPEAP